MLSGLPTSIFQESVQEFLQSGRPWASLGFGPVLFQRFENLLILSRPHSPKYSDVLGGAGQESQHTATHRTRDVHLYLALARREKENTVPIHPRHNLQAKAPIPRTNSACFQASFSRFHSHPTPAQVGRRSASIAVLFPMRSTV